MYSMNPIMMMMMMMMMMTMMIWPDHVTVIETMVKWLPQQNITQDETTMWK